MINANTFETWLKSHFHRAKLPGLASVLIQSGEVLSMPCFGFADLDRHSEVIPDTPFLMSSLTKPLSAIVLLSLARQGLIDLDAPIRQYYRNYDVFCDRLKRYARDGVEPTSLFRHYNGIEYDITLRHHLTHTAQWIPGTRFFYNSFLYGVISRAVEGALNLPYYQVFATQLIHPLKLRNTSPHTSGISLLALDQPIACSYYLRDSIGYHRSEFPEVAFSASAGLAASINDLAAIDLALDNGTLLDEADLRQLWTPFRLKNGSDSCYGVGWYVQPYRHLTLCWHSGWWDDASSALYLRIPEYELTLIVLANSDGLRWHSESQPPSITDSPLIMDFLDTLLGD